jgi:hypothetical protein
MIPFLSKSKNLIGMSGWGEKITVNDLMVFFTNAVFAVMHEVIYF